MGEALWRFPHQSFGHSSMHAAMKIDGDPEIITDRVSHQADTPDDLVQFTLVNRYNEVRHMRSS
jgi:hypothetical protein